MHFAVARILGTEKSFKFQVPSGKGWQPSNVTNWSFRFGLDSVLVVAWVLPQKKTSPTMTILDIICSNLGLSPQVIYDHGIEIDF